MIFLAYGVTLWAHAAPPSLTDYANWTYQGVLLRNHLLGAPDAFHTLKRYPVPNDAATLGIGLLALVLPWIAAAKTWLCVQFLISFFCFRHLRGSLSGTEQSAALWLIVPGAVFLNINFWYGFVNFQLGLCWVLLTASLLLRRVQGRYADWPLGLVLLLAFFTHMIPFAVCALLLLTFARQTKRWRVLWQLAPAAAASAWYVIGRYLFARDADGQTGMHADLRYMSGRFWAHKVNSYTKSFGYVDPHGLNRTLLGDWGTLLLLLVALTVCLSLGWAMIAACRKAFRERRNECFLWLGILLVLPLFLLAPETAFGVSDPGSRLLQAVLALALVLAGASAHSSARRALWLGAAGSMILTVVGFGMFVRLAFPPHLPEPRVPPGMHTLDAIGFVAYEDQDDYYEALGRGDLSIQVFPTGMFLNTPEATPARIPLGPNK